MLRLPLLIALSLTIAFGGGIWSTLVALDATIGFGAIRLGAWEAFPQAQTAAADPYAKSHRANAGKLLYGTAEGLTFVAAVDDGGARLDGSCTYRMSGHTPPARLWSLFTNDANGRPPSENAELPAALNSRTVLRDRDGNFVIDISASAHPRNWLAVTAGQPFKLVLTLFDTPTAGSSGLIDLAMPKVEKIGCGNA